jgi:hypothetical protein
MMQGFHHLLDQAITITAAYVMQLKMVTKFYEGASHEMFLLRPDPPDDAVLGTMPVGILDSYLCLANPAVTA